MSTVCNRQRRSFGAGGRGVDQASVLVFVFIALLLSTRNLAAVQERRGEDRQGPFSPTGAVICLSTICLSARLAAFVPSLSVSLSS